VLLAGEVLGLRALVGGALVVAGMVVAQVWPARPGAARPTSPPAAG